MNNELRTSELRPRLPGWEELSSKGADPELVANAIAISFWQKGTTCVISALEDAEYPDGVGHGPQWHVSVSHLGRSRPRPHEIRRTLRAFGIAEIKEEDNHHPGNARHFFVPVDPAKRVTCQCKLDEDVIVEPDGYAWTNPKDGPCRGCELQRLTGKPCPLHPK